MLGRGGGLAPAADRAARRATADAPVTRRKSRRRYWGVLQFMPVTISTTDTTRQRRRHFAAGASVGAFPSVCLLVASYWWRLTGGVLLAASCWWRLTGGVLLAASYWRRLTGGVSPAASHWRRLTGGVSPAAKCRRLCCERSAGGKGAGRAFRAWFSYELPLDSPGLCAVEPGYETRLERLVSRRRHDLR